LTGTGRGNLSREAPPPSCACNAKRLGRVKDQLKPITFTGSKNAAHSPGACGVLRRYRALILLATFASLRWAELAALTPHDIDLDACTVRVTRQISYPPGGGHFFGPPKSRADRRVVSFPDLIVPDIRAHLDGLGQAAALVFTSPDGRPLRHSNFYRRAWMPALAASGLVGTHFHDLRHAGNQFIADAGANPCELMARMGHDSARAALIYLHSSAERQRVLADEVGWNARVALSKAEGQPKRSGTRKARNRRKAS
jgi:integrase